MEGAEPTDDELLAEAIRVSLETAEGEELAEAAALELADAAAGVEPEQEQPPAAAVEVGDAGAAAFLPWSGSPFAAPAAATAQQLLGM